MGEYTIRLQKRGRSLHQKASSTGTDHCFCRYRALEVDEGQHVYSRCFAGRRRNYAYYAYYHFYFFFFSHPDTAEPNQWVFFQKKIWKNAMVGGANKS